MKRILSLVLSLLFVLPLLAGCHGAEGLPAFGIPEDFDLSRSYEISFWAKNDTNVTQTRIY